MKKVHMISINRAMRPRGSLAKNSLSEYIFQLLKGNVSSWTDDAYDDSVPTDQAVEIFEQIVQEEVDLALEAFRKYYRADSF